MNKPGQVASQIVDLLTPFDAVEQQRIVSAAMTLLGNGDPMPTREKQTGEKPKTHKREGTINVVASKMGSDSCRKLLIAAAVHLSLFQGKEKWTRDEWTRCASSARDWKNNFSSSVARDIDRLVKAGIVIENSANVFSLSTGALADAETKL